MIIILEGPDGGGKTTLANTLAVQTGYKIIHRSHPETEEEKQQMVQSYLQAIKTNTNAIFDRCWYSEMTYGPVMRGNSVVSYPEMYKLERLLAKKGAMIIYCTDTKANLWSRCTRRGEDYITSMEKFNEICTNYEVLMLGAPHLIPVVTYEVQE